MKRTFSTLLAIILMVGLIFVPVAMPVQATSTIYNFDRTLAPWLPGSDYGAFNEHSLVREPGSGSPFCVDESAGYASIVDFFAPNKGEGSWMVAAIEASGPTRIELNWNSVYKRQSPTWCSKGCEMVAYIGTDLPIDSEQFTTLGSLADSWKAYQYGKTISADGTVHIAIGWRVGAGIPADLWEHEMIVNVDCLSVNVRAIGK